MERLGQVDDEAADCRRETGEEGEEQRHVEGVGAKGDVVVRVAPLGDRLDVCARRVVEIVAVTLKLGRPVLAGNDEAGDAGRVDGEERVVEAGVELEGVAHARGCPTQGVAGEAFSTLAFHQVRRQVLQLFHARRGRQGGLDEHQLHRRVGVSPADLLRRPGVRQGIRGKDADPLVGRAAVVYS